MVSEAMRNNGNPEGMLRQMMSNATPEQRQNLFNQAKGYGVPEDVLSKVQNMK